MSFEAAADELVMMMNGFDTNFDTDNEVYAVNTIANYYMHKPIRVTVGRLVRIYLVNVTEFDLLNSLHLHGMFFDVYRTGTRLRASDHTDTVMLCQGERAILETTFRYPGDFMFHAHQSEFAELGWMGLFRAVEAAVKPDAASPRRPTCRGGPPSSRAMWLLALLPLLLLAACSRRSSGGPADSLRGANCRPSSGWPSSASSWSPRASSSPCSTMVPTRSPSRRCRWTMRSGRFGGAGTTLAHLGRTT